MTTTLEWLGAATFRLAIGAAFSLLDAYIDRVPAAQRLGVMAALVSASRTAMKNLD